jgi:site-specific recombinase XerD
MFASEILESLDEFPEFLLDRRGASDRTTKAYVSDVRGFASFLVFQAAGEAAAPQHSEQCDLPSLYLSWLRHQRKSSPATIRRKLVALTIYCRWRVERGRSEVSPFEDHKLIVRIPKRLPRALSRADAKTLLGGPRETGGSSDAETNVALQLLLATGVRIGEMCSIDTEDVATDGAAIRIKGKGDRERTVFVGNSSLQHALANLARRRITDGGPAAPLFLNRRSRRLTPQAFRLRLHQIAAASGIATRITPHRLRHTAATLLLEEGVDIRFVQKLLGHSSIATTEIYTKVADASLQAVLIRADPLGSMRR